MLLAHDSVLRIVSEIKDTNTASANAEGAGVDWESELGLFLAEVKKLEDVNEDESPLSTSIDVLVEMCTLTVGALHKSGLDAEAIVAEILKSQVVEIRAIHTPEHYRNSAASVLRTALLTITTLVGETLAIAWFDEANRS